MIEIICILKIRKIRKFGKFGNSEIRQFGNSERNSEIPKFQKLLFRRKPSTRLSGAPSAALQLSMRSVRIKPLAIEAKACGNNPARQPADREVMGNGRRAT